MVQVQEQVKEQPEAAPSYKSKSKKLLPVHHWQVLALLQHHQSGL